MWMDALWRLVSMLASASSSEFVAGTSALVGVVLVAVLARVLLVRPAGFGDFRGAGRALRRRADRVGVPRHRDPDASGRTRPRGPTAAAAVA
ncbi:MULTISPECIES: DUF6412 domain-containing protein [Actinoplanes]|uniref:Uncharacterized protein n=2 Tax=Actinoplanes TaxID=1865 RepID=A0A101JSM3_9ACTN|nr:MULTISPECIES: DUF6412 domain-containing protein [Actinoplanes]KUL31968.1 hypothetical protein ADL15_20905 [Actinoplanes awajinensis subsp. mycoplanecinus]GIE70328.1 hypothetical protein Apa02nite_064360 [Actinoplanes palleronii]